jgi:hypothetical protein
MRKVSEKTKMKLINSKYDFEINSWLRTLDYLLQENIYMKNHIAEVVNGNSNANVLERMEQFQNAFLNKDTVIAFLRMDIKRLKQDIAADMDIRSKYLLFRSDMEKMEREYRMLRNDFNEYLLAVA